ncbi:MerR family transcriptional regulator [Fibrobacterales bacterium]|nr:MerR family transcriptional regulator [Fibrobacterales bacterium]
MARYGKPRSEPMYFTTLQICDVLGVESSWLRSLEKCFKDIKPIINGSGKRRYRKLDFERIVWIYTQVESGIKLQSINLDLHQIPSTEYKTVIDKPVAINKSKVKVSKVVKFQSVEPASLNLKSAELSLDVKKRLLLLKRAKSILKIIREKITIQ